MGGERVAVVGAGMAGLVAAVDLAARGVEVVVLERAAAPGGKMREVKVGGRLLDVGPTVLTMPWVFEEIFAAAGTSLARHLTLHPAEILARHAWDEGGRLDLFADARRTADAVGSFAGSAEARGYLRFRDQARRIYETLEQPFIRATRPSPFSLAGRVGVRGLGGLLQIKPFATLWGALGEYFHDDRLRQLFGRYATYCGSSPYLAPATLMLVAHVEQEGVWLVEGGMHRLAEALAALAAKLGVTFRYETEVSEVRLAGGKVSGVVTALGERLDATAVVVNADVTAVAAGLFGHAVAAAVPSRPASARSLSAATWALVASTAGFPLVRHNVFFSKDYAREFDDILTHHRLPTAPTVYVCAQDRSDADGPADDGAERLFCIVNAPPTGDHHAFDNREIEECAKRTFRLLERCGLEVRHRPEMTRVTTPAGFHGLFPGTGGALYGQASHGWAASFARPGARTRIPGLYLAGGSTHPGPGVPMAALSGRLAASSLVSDLGSTNRSRATATRGGTSTA